MLELTSESGRQQQQKIVATRMGADADGGRSDRLGEHMLVVKRPILAYKNPETRLGSGAPRGGGSTTQCLDSAARSAPKACTYPVQTLAQGADSERQCGAGPDR